MEPRLIDLEKDLFTINSWLIKRDKVPMDKKYYPELGVIVDNIYAVFIYETNTYLAFQENAISNPAASKEDRAQAIKISEDFINLLCLQRGIKLLYGRTNNDSLLNHAKNNNWRDMGKMNLIVKHVGGK